MSTWDSEDFEPGAEKLAQNSKWEGEDDDGTKDNWEDDNEEIEKSEDESTETKQKKDPDSLAKDVAEKSGKALNASDPDKSTEQKAETVSQHGTEDKTTAEAKGQIDVFEPTNKEQFDKFNEMLKQKITNFEKSPFYVQFLDSLLHGICNNMEADDIKKLLNTINAVSNEKVKQQKTTKGKKKSKKATLTVGKDIEKDEMDEVGYDDLDDYI